MELKELVEELAKALVNNPEEVSVKEMKSDHITVYSLTCAKEDVGVMIGKGGRTAMAIRHLLSTVAGKNHRNIVFDIAD